ncbi:MAG: response regulator [Chloroflexi bacterium]|nr:response regulator [Chloroflexota bacterium]MDA1271733.1 response regulator [Chloroflexota bacterium]
MQTLLIADDEEDVMELMQATLKFSGYRMLSAVDGPEALEIARREIPELALLDVMMPGMDGFEVCRLLKGDPLTANIKIVMLTASSQDSDRQIGIDAGADEYITKPFSPAALLRTVSDIMGDNADR